MLDPNLKETAEIPIIGGNQGSSMRQITLLLFASVLILCSMSSATFITFLEPSADILVMKKNITEGNWNQVLSDVHKSVARIVGEDFVIPSISFEAKAGNESPAIYKNGKIKVYPNTWNLAKGIFDENETKESILIVLAHELAHAWQDQKTSLLEDPQSTHL